MGASPGPFQFPPAAESNRKPVQAPTIDPSENSSDLPVYGAGTDGAYTLEVIAELADVDSTTVLRYQEAGFIQPVANPGEETALFDEECLRKLRQIQHLRTACGVNEDGLKLILDLLHEVEVLRQEQRIGPV